MPPKVRVTREMVLDAAYSLVREEGYEELNARAVARRLQCSTQPVMYNFTTAEALRNAVYERADAYHSEYIMRIGQGNPALSLGLNYIRFAAEEPNLFRFLFLSDHFGGMDMETLLHAPELHPLLDVLAHLAGRSEEAIREQFRAMFIMAHGYACLLAGNSMRYDEAMCIRDLTNTFRDLFPKRSNEE